MSFVKEFKEFAMRGNVVDLAVGVVIGGAFGKIVSSLVADIIMPLIGAILGSVDFKNLSFVLKAAHGDVPAITLNYGLFIQNVVDFLIIAFAIFICIKFINKLKKQEDEVPQTPPAPSNEEVLLTQIRDILKNK